MDYQTLSDYSHGWIFRHRDMPVPDALMADIKPLSEASALQYWRQNISKEATHASHFWGMIGHRKMVFGIPKVSGKLSGSQMIPSCLKGWILMIGKPIPTSSSVTIVIMLCKRRGQRFASVGRTFFFTMRNQSLSVSVDYKSRVFTPMALLISVLTEHVFVSFEYTD